MVATWADPTVTWDGRLTTWDGLDTPPAPLMGILWTHDGTKWIHSKDVLIKGSDGTAFLEPWVVMASDGIGQYVCYPIYSPPAIPGPVLNLRATVVTASVITVAWDASTDPTVTSYRYNMRTVVDVNVGNVTSRQQTGLAANTTYTIDVYALNSSGSSVAATITVKTGATPPTITTWGGAAYNQVNLTVTGDNPMTLNCVGGSRNGQTWGWNAGNNYIGGCAGTEYWTVSNAGGSTGRFYTVAGTPYQAPIAGAVNNTFLFPTAVFGRGNCYPIAWDCPAMATHPSFSAAWMTDGNTSSRWQTGNYPSGWLELQIGVEAGYRVRRFWMQNGPATEEVTPVYSVDQGGSWKRWSHGFGVWVDWASGGQNAGTVSPMGLLSITSTGSWDRDWNWQVTDNSSIWFPYIPENATDLTQRWIYVRYGLVHLGGSAGANCAEVAIEYQTPSTPAVAEVMCGVAWG